MKFGMVPEMTGDWQGYKLTVAIFSPDGQKPKAL
jgi:hypothetical protein